MRRRKNVYRTPARAQWYYAGRGTLRHNIGDGRLVLVCTAEPQAILGVLGQHFVTLYGPEGEVWCRRMDFLAVPELIEELRT